MEKTKENIIEDITLTNSNPVPTRTFSVISGDKYELSMYDFLKGAEYTLMIAQQQILDGTKEASKWEKGLVDDFDKGRDWFRFSLYNTTTDRCRDATTICNN